MENILFFDADRETRLFSKRCPLEKTRYIYFSESFSEISLKKLAPYLETRIISIFTHSSPLDNKRLDLFKNLSFIATRSTGFNHIDLNYCKKRNILVSNVPQYGAITVAEYTFGLLLNLSRHIIQSSDDMRHNEIQMHNYTGIDLSDKTIGIIGTGSIGKYMIQLAKGFNMKILAFDLFQDKNLSPYYVSSLKELYQKSDIISLHIPSTPKNIHLLNAQAFKLMKKGVLILNTSRGNLIDTAALYQAIIQKKVAGAGLDVLENEDFLVHDEANPHAFEDNKELLLTSTMNLKLMQLKNVIMTPHIAFNSYDAIERINKITCQNIRAFLSGHPINLQSLR